MMWEGKRVAVLGVLAVLGLALIGQAYGRVGSQRDLTEPGPYVDAQERELRTESGSRINYDSSGQAIIMDKTGAPPPKSWLRGFGMPSIQNAGATAGSPLEWYWVSLGSGIGAAGLHAVDVDDDGEVEVVASGGSGRYWYILSPDAQEWASQPYEHIVGALAVAQGDASPELEVFVGVGADVLVYDGQSRELEATIPIVATAVVALAAGDVDADGAVEIVLCDTSDLFVYDLATGLLETQKFGFGGTDLALGEVDGDAPMEIAIATGSAGFVLDGSSLEVQWGRPSDFGSIVHLANLNGTGFDEVVGGAVWSGLTVFDVATDSEMYTVPIFNLATIHSADMDGDDSLELLYGDAQWGDIHCLAGATGAELWSVPNPEHGVTHIAVSDVDGDEVEEILWGAGYSSSGPDYLYVADASTRSIEWQSMDLRGPFLGLDYGDYDADSDPELLWTSFSSDSGYDDGLYLIYDAATRQLEHVSAPPTGANWTGLWKARSANIDADPQLEICITTGITYSGRIACYDGLSHGEEWHVDIASGTTFRSLDIVDVDGNGSLEVVAAVGADHTGAEGIYVYAYQAATGLLHWRSPDLGGLWGELTLLRIADVDGDPQAEVVVAAANGWLQVLDATTGSVQLGQVPLAVTALDTADRDGDGKAEILVGTDDGYIYRVDSATGDVVDPIGPFGGVVRGLNVIEVTGDSVKDYVFAADSKLMIVNGATLDLAWSDEPWGAQAGQHDSLLVADVDQDLDLEIVVNTGVGVAVFGVPRPLFSDGFESGDTTAWSSVVP